MKLKDVLDYFAFHDVSVSIDADNNVIGCVSEYGEMSCKECQCCGCKCHPEAMQ